MTGNTKAKHPVPEGTFQMRFGALSAPIREQLARQGLKANGVRSWQRLADAVTRLYLNGYLTAREARSARQKILNNLASDVRPTRGSNARHRYLPIHQDGAKERV